MTKLVITSIDRVLANGDARFAKAEQAKNEYLDLLDERADSREATNMYWHTALTPELVPLDTPVNHAGERLETLRQAGYIVVIVSSRPEAMRDVTVRWLRWHFVDDDSFHRGKFPLLVMKPASEQYTKTFIWVVQQIRKLLDTYKPSELIYVDGEQVNLQAVCDMRDWHRQGECTLKLAETLAEAVDEREANT